eukprot:scaffold46255_cov20-Tisochrysis_lutea.AAC.2
MDVLRTAAQQLSRQTHSATAQPSRHSTGCAATCHANAKLRVEQQGAEDMRTRNSCAPHMGMHAT